MLCDAVAPQDEALEAAVCGEGRGERRRALCDGGMQRAVGDAGDGRKVAQEETKPAHVLCEARLARCDLGQISARSRPDLGQISAGSRLDLVLSAAAAEATVRSVPPTFAVLVRAQF